MVTGGLRKELDCSQVPHSLVNELGTRGKVDPVGTLGPDTVPEDPVHPLVTALEAAGKRRVAVNDQSLEKIRPGLSGEPLHLGKTEGVNRKARGPALGSTTLAHIGVSGGGVPLPIQGKITGLHAIAKGELPALLHALDLQPDIAGEVLAEIKEIAPGPGLRDGDRNWLSLLNHPDRRCRIALQ